MGLAATASGLLFDIAPELRPDPGVQISASMRVVDVDRGVTLGDYVKRVHWSKGVSESLADDRGDVAYVRMSVRGRKGHHLALAESVYGIPGRQRMPGRADFTSQFFRDDTTNDQWIAEVFVPRMLKSQRFFARFELWEGKDLLAYADTPVLHGSVVRLE